MPESDRPAWMETLRRHYLAGSSSFFILHGNTEDLVGAADADAYALASLPDAISRELFGTYDLVFAYDVGQGLRLHPGDEPRRLADMTERVERLGFDPTQWPREPGPALRLLDRILGRLLLAKDRPPPKTAFLFDYGELLCPPGDRSAEALALLLTWARHPVVRRVNAIFVLLAPSLGQLHPGLVQSGYTTAIRVPLPDPAERRACIQSRFDGPAQEAERLAALSAGLTLANLDNLLRLARWAEAQAGPQDATAPTHEASDGPTPGEDLPAALTAGCAPPRTPPQRDAFLKEAKKQLIESQCPGLLRFVDPDSTLADVAGHTTAKARLTEDAALIRQGALDLVPMGYLVCGPVGAGKSFLVQSYAGTVGIPCVELQNFRSKYVGETEANLERILGVLGQLGPVAVLVDEADAALGTRGAVGDSGTSARVFARLAAQMGDTRFRGRIIWFLLTCRPDRVPIDLKRQGRCEEHIPLFYPATGEERTELFLAMARKRGDALTPGQLPDLGSAPDVSGADIESLLMRIQRTARLRGVSVDPALVEEALADFRSARGPEHKLQWLAAVLECSDLRYLPPRVRERVASPEGLAALQARFRTLQAGAP